MLLVTIVAALYRPDRRPAETFASPALKASIEFPNTWLIAPTLSPDGRYLSMNALGGGPEGRTVLIRRLEDGDVTWLDIKTESFSLAWSADSRSLAVSAEGELKAVDVATGGVRTIGKVPTDIAGIAWNRDDILLGGVRLQRLSVANGQLTDLYTPGY